MGVYKPIYTSVYVTTSKRSVDLDLFTCHRQKVTVAVIRPKYQEITNMGTMAWRRTIDKEGRTILIQGLPRAEENRGGGKIHERSYLEETM